MSDNIVNIDFKPHKSLEKLIDNIREMDYDELIFVGIKDNEIYLGVSEMEDLAYMIGNLNTAEQYLSLLRLGKWE